MSFRRLAILTVLAAIALSACSGSSSDKQEDSTQGDSRKLVQVSALTGLPLKKGEPNNPVFVVKIENTAGGQPQYALDKADMVFEELVEGGLTRLAALYYSELPDKVGHVRSMRTTDIGIAAPVSGQIVASGGAAGTYSKVKSAGITVHSEDHAAPGFSSDPLKSRPYNRLVDLKVLAKDSAAKKGGEIKAPYVTWGGADQASTVKSKKATEASVRFSNSSTTFWKLADKKWQRENSHAEPGTDFKADSMIVLFCDVVDAGYRDPAGNPVPETELEGSGRAVIFHGNKVTEAKWSKKSPRATLTFADKEGEPLAISPGKLFFELVPKGDGAVAFN